MIIRKINGRLLTVNRGFRNVTRDTHMSSFLTCQT